MSISEANVCPATEGERPSASGEDPVLERWLARPAARRPVSSWPPRRAETGEREPIGDSVADEWFF
jgi:hypothetical protein